MRTYYINGFKFKAKSMKLAIKQACLLGLDPQTCVRR